MFQVKEEKKNKDCFSLLMKEIQKNTHVIWDGHNISAHRQKVSSIEMEN